MDNLSEIIRKSEKELRKEIFLFSQKDYSELARKPEGTRGYVLFSNDNPIHMAVCYVKAGRGANYSDNYNSVDKKALELIKIPDLLVVPYQIGGNENELFASAVELNSAAKGNSMNYFCKVRDQKPSIFAVLNDSGLIREVYLVAEPVQQKIKNKEYLERTKDIIMRLFC